MNSTNVITETAQWVPQAISTREILVGDSPYYFSPFFLLPETINPASSQNKIPMAPILVYKEGTEFCLLDGKKRFHASRILNNSQISCLVLFEKTLPESLHFYFLQSHLDFLSQSDILKIKYVEYLNQHGISEVVITRDFFPLLNFNNKIHSFKKLLKMAALPKKLFVFCHNKKISLKQLALLSSYSPEILKFVSIYLAELSHSQFFEFLALVKNFNVQKDQPAENIFREEIYQTIFEQYPPKLALDKCLALLKIRKNPLLLEQNNQLELALSNLGLPENVKFFWDKTLEKKEVNLQIRLSKNQDWEKLIHYFKKEGLESKIVPALDCF